MLIKFRFGRVVGCTLALFWLSEYLYLCRFYNLLDLENATRVGRCALSSSRYLDRSRVRRFWDACTFFLCRRRYYHYYRTPNSLLINLGLPFARLVCGVEHLRLYTGREGLKLSKLTLVSYCEQER